MENSHGPVDCSMVGPLYYANIEEHMSASCAPRREQLLETLFPICSELNPMDVTTSSSFQIQSQTSKATAIPSAKCGYDAFGLPDMLMRFVDYPMQIGLLPFNPPINTLQFETSQSYLKRFIMFDHSGGKGRALLHPALVQELSAISPHSLSLLEHVDHVDSSNASRMIDHVFGVTLDERLMAYKETFTSSSAGLQYMKVSRMSAMPQGKIEGVLLDDEAESMNRISDAEENERAGVVDSASCVAGENDAVDCEADNSRYWHEDTDDIDALLSSDDEVSSVGYFPDDCFPVVPSLPESNLQKKRRTSSMSKETSVNTSALDLKTSYVSALAAAVGRYQNTTCSNYREITDESRNAYGYISGQITSARNARKRKIKTTVQRLRKIIPGGDRMEEAVVVLDEVIRYVRSLQQKVQQMEASRTRKLSVDEQKT